MLRSIRILSLSLGAAVSLVACSEAPPPPEAPKPPDAPTADTQLRDTIQKPIDRAKSVEGIIMKSHDRQDKQLQSDEGASSSASPPSE